MDWSSALGGWYDIICNFDYLMKGLWNTILLALCAIIGSFILGVLLGIARYSKLFIVSWVATAYIEFIRAIPLILFIFFVHFWFLPYVFKIQTTLFLSACVALIIFTAAYVAEIVRGGLQSIEKGYIEASRSLGLNYIQMMWHIVLPIALSRMTPALVGQFIALLKDTSLASIIGYIELTRSAQIVYGRTFNDFELLIFISVVYFVICFSLSLISRKLEVNSRLGETSLNMDYN